MEMSASANACSTISQLFSIFVRAQTRVMTSGNTVAGTRMANIASVHDSTRSSSLKWQKLERTPHLQPRFARTAFEIFGPMKPFKMNGMEASDETRPRHFNVVMSAIII